MVSSTSSSSVGEFGLSIWREDGEFFQYDHEGISRERIHTLETDVEKWIESPQIEKKCLPLTQSLSVSEGRRRQITTLIPFVFKPLGFCFGLFLREGSP